MKIFEGGGEKRGVYCVLYSWFWSGTLLDPPGTVAFSFFFSCDYFRLFPLLLVSVTIIHEWEFVVPYFLLRDTVGMIDSINCILALFGVNKKS